MLPNTYDGTRKTDPSVHRAIVEHRIKVIDQRRSEIEFMLGTNTTHPDSSRTQELQTELAALNATRAECDAILRPAAKPARSPELQRAYDRQREKDKLLLKVTIRERTKQAVYAAEQLESAGEHRQARLTRNTIPELGELICKEFAIDPVLLGEINQE